jgi:hypothetical protein
MTATKIVELVISDDNQELAIDAISLVTAPAIESEFVFFGKEKNNLTFAKVDEEKRMLISPALIPNKQIFRHDPNTDSDYYVYFSKETVQKASELYLKHNNHHKATYQHQDRVSGVLTVESWIIEDTKLDKSTLYGYSLPVGTWMVKLSISNDEMWSKIKSGELKGLSIEGYFTNKFEQMNKKQPTQEQILSALNELIKESKTELKTERVELGLKEDVKKTFNTANDDFAKGFNNMEDAKSILAKAEKDFIKSQKNYKATLDGISKFEKAVKDLGVDVPKDIIKTKKTAETNLKGSVKNLGNVKQAKKLSDFS